MRFEEGLAAHDADVLRSLVRFALVANVVIDLAAVVVVVAATAAGGGTIFRSRLVPSSVGRQISRTVEPLFTFRTSVFDENNHAAPVEK